MVTLRSIPKNAIVSIRQNDESPYEFMNRNTAEKVINSRSGGKRISGGKRTYKRSYKRSRPSRKRPVGGVYNIGLADVCTTNPLGCGEKGGRKH